MIEPGLLNFIDAYNETVGLLVSDQPGIVYADCNDLSSLNIAISKLQDRIGRKGVLLIFDSLTSPYLFNGSEILRFMSQTLSRFAADGNAVMACIDEGCGKQEDLVAMMSQVHGIMKIEMEDDQRNLNVIKHPQMEAVRIPFSVTRVPRTIPYEINSEILKKFSTGEAGSLESLRKWETRKVMKDGVNILWYQIIFWSGLQWDPQRFPSLCYNLTKDSLFEAFRLMRSGVGMKWYMKLLLKIMMSYMFPKGTSVKKVKKFIRRYDRMFKIAKIFRLEYLDEISQDDEHYIRKTESPISWGFPKVDASLCFHDAAELAATFAFIDREGRDWNAVEYKCIGRGDPYCELKIVPENSSEFQDFLRMVDAPKLEKINEHIQERILDLVFHGKGLQERPTLGNEMHYHEVIEDTSLLATFSERYQVALRLAGANSGRKMGELFLDNGATEAQATNHLINLFQLTNAGRLTVGETFRMEENCESYGVQVGQSLCFFTTSFLNGFFSMVKNQHLKETKCQAAGDDCCEWEFSQTLKAEIEPISSVGTKLVPGKIIEPGKKSPKEKSDEKFPKKPEKVDTSSTDTEKRTRDLKDRLAEEERMLDALEEGFKAGELKRQAFYAQTNKYHENIEKLEEQIKELEFLEKYSSAELNEEQITIFKEKKFCLVHRGPIEGAMYSCPSCGNLYCARCAKALDHAGEPCWACKRPIEY